jgi:hypothetical protein
MPARRSAALSRSVCCARRGQGREGRCCVHQDQDGAVQGRRRGGAGATGRGRGSESGASLTRRSHCEASARAKALAGACAARPAGAAVPRAPACGRRVYPVRHHCTTGLAGRMSDSRASRCGVEAARHGRAHSSACTTGVGHDVAYDSVSQQRLHAFLGLWFSLFSPRALTCNGGGTRVVEEAERQVVGAVQDPGK